MLEIENKTDNSKLGTGDSEMAQTKNVLLYLAKYFEPELVSKIEPTFDEQVLKHVNSDKNILLRSYLTDTLQLKDEVSEKIHRLKCTGSDQFLGTANMCVEVIDSRYYITCGHKIGC